MSTPQIGSNTFEKGMNSDLSKTFQQSNTYLEAVNFEIVTEDGQSTGALINIKGTQLAVTLPNINNNPQNKDLVPIGWCNIREDIYVITTSKVNTTLNPGGVNPELPTNPATAGHIFKIVYNKETLSFTTTLIYSANMNLSLQYPIANPGMIEGRYEGPLAQRIYWTDNFNQLRSINVADPNLSTLNIKTIDIVPDFIPSNTTVEDVLDGVLPEGVFQVAYRYMNRQGALTKFSVPSLPFQLASGDLFGSIIDYPLSDSLNPNNDELLSEKAVKVKIHSLDTTYDYVQLAYIVYTSKGIGQVKLLPPNKIPSSGTYIDTITGLEEGTETFNINEFSSFSNPFLTVGTIAQKNNILFAANTKTKEFDVEFDARAYRYKSDQTTYITLPLAEDADAINPFNDESSGSWSSNQYKFKADGITLGGEGPNVSYTFVTKSLDVDTDSDEPLGAPFIKPATLNTTDIVGTTVFPVKSFASFKSPFVQTLYTGYARGEVYRFGIVFWDKKGNPSFVKWVGDIKFPDNNDSGFGICSYAADTATLKSIGIRFSINLGSITSNISGYSICRVERKEQDKTRLGFGITGGFNSYGLGAMTINEFISNIRDISFNIFKSSFSNTSSGMFSGLFTGGIADKFANAMEEALIELQGGASGTSSVTAADGFKVLNEDAIKMIVKQSFMSIGSSTGGILVDTIVGDKLVDFLSEALVDFIIRKVAGINERVYALGNSIENKTFGYIVSPITAFNRYNFRPNDYIRLVGKYDLTGSKVRRVYNYQTDTGALIADDSSAAYRKWYNYTAYTNADNKRTITKQKVLERGEQVKNGFDPVTLGTSSADYVLCNAYIGSVERFIGAASIIPVINTFQPRRTLGIGDKKHFVIFNSAVPSMTNTTWLSDQPSSGTTLNDPRVIDKGGDYLVSYERYVAEQYGGNTYYHRTTNQYIICSPFIPTYSGTLGINVYGGDTYVAAYDAVNYGFYMKEVAGYKKPIRLKKAMAEIFPVEVPFNTELREEVHFSRNQDSDDLDVPSRREKRKERRLKKKAAKRGLELDPQSIDDANLELALQRFVFDQFNYNNVYDQSFDVIKLFHKPLIDNFNEHQSNTIWSSEKKFDGELIDSWRRFKVNNFIDVEGSCGPITSLINHKDKLMFIQTKGFGVAAVNERAVTATSIGETVLGNGAVLSRYDYISKEIGSAHRFSITSTDTAIYFYDVSTNKFYVSNGNIPQSLSDIKGISGFLNRTINSDIINNDNPILSKGVTIIHDPKHNRLFFTAHESNGSFTVSYNEAIQAFTSFWSFTPVFYMNDGYNVFSATSLSSNIHIHNKGNYSNFYGTAYPSSITVLSNKFPTSTKVYDAVSYSSESTTKLGVDNPADTFNTVKCVTDYQSTSVTNLVNLNTIRRAERSWQFHVPRNSSLERLRDKSMAITLTYDNTNNNRFICNYINTQFRASSR